MTNDDDQPQLDPTHGPSGDPRGWAPRSSEVRQMLIRFMPPANAADMAADLASALGLAPAIRRNADGTDLLTVSVPAELGRMLRQVAEIHGGRVERDVPVGPSAGARASRELEAADGR